MSADLRIRNNSQNAVALLTPLSPEFNPNGEGKSLLDKLFYPVKIHSDFSALKQDSLKISFWKNYERDCPLRAASEGLDLFSAGSKIAKGWNPISGVEVTLDRVFVAVDGKYTIVLPRRHLGEKTLQGLIETIRRLAKLSPQKVA